MTSLAQHTHPYPGIIVRKVQVFAFFSGHPPIAAYLALPARFMKHSLVPRLIHPQRFGGFHGE